MEVCDAIVMLFDVTPDCHAVSVIAVKRPVHKLDLRHFMIQEKLQFLLYQLHASKPHPLIDRRKAITARKRAASARLIIENTILKRHHIFIFFIYKRNFIQTDRCLRQSLTDLPFRVPPYNTMALVQFVHRLFAIYLVKSGKFTKSPLTLAFHNAAKFRMLRQKFLCIIGNLRSASPDFQIRQNLIQICCNILNKLQIPDIAGKCHHIRLSLINIHQNIISSVIDRIFRKFHLNSSLCRITFQAVHRKIGMYIFRIDCDQQYFHAILLIQATPCTSSRTPDIT